MVVTYSVSKEDIAQLAEEKARKASKTVNLKGFRPGKAARALVGKLFKRNTWPEAAEELALGQIAQQVGAAGEQAAEIPGFDTPAEKGKDFEGETEVALMPRVEELKYPEGFTLAEDATMAEACDLIERALTEMVGLNRMRTPGSLVSALEKSILYEFTAFCELGGFDPQVGAGDYNRLKNHAIQRADHLCVLHEIARHENVPLEEAMDLFIERLKPNV